MRVGVLAAAGAAVIAVALAAYGTWARDRDVDQLQRRADAAAAPRVAVVSPKPAPAEASLTLPGQVAAWNESQIYAQVSGYIGQWFTDYGARVTSGQELATIQTPGLDAQYEAAVAQLKVAQANQNIAELTAKRFDALKGTGYETQQTIDDRDADALAKTAAATSAQENVDHYKAMLAFKRIVAPYAGVITARRVNVGDFIGADGADDTSGSAGGRAPFAISDVSRLRVFVSVPESLTGALQPGLTAVLHTPADPGKAIPAKFLTKAGAVQTATRTMVTEFEVDAPDGTALTPGAYVNATLTYPGRSDLVTVPSQAVLFRARGPQVAIVDGGGRVHLKSVSIGRDLGLDVEVTAGLTASDEIVANPSLGLLEGEKVEPVQPEPGYQPGSGAEGTDAASTSQTDSRTAPPPPGGTSAAAPSQ